MNMYSLACSLRANQPVPRYLPSAAAARQKLLEKMEEVDAEVMVKQEGTNRMRRWADVYRYAFSAALSDVVVQVEELEVYTKEVVGEMGFGCTT